MKLNRLLTFEVITECYDSTNIYSNDIYDRS